MRFSRPLMPSPTTSNRNRHILHGGGEMSLIAPRGHNLMKRRPYTDFQQIMLLSLTVRATEGIQGVHGFKDALVNLLPTIRVQAADDHNYLHITMAAVVRWQVSPGFKHVSRMLNGKPLEKNMDDLAFCKAWVRLYLKISELCEDAKAHLEAQELQQELRFHFKD